MLRNESLLEFVTAKSFPATLEGGGGGAGTVSNFSDRFSIGFEETRRLISILNRGKTQEALFFIITTARYDSIFIHLWYGLFLLLQFKNN